jgi:hypothetical protein
MPCDLGKDVRGKSGLDQGLRLCLNGDASAGYAEKNSELLSENNEFMYSISLH